MDFISCALHSDERHHDNYDCVSIMVCRSELDPDTHHEGILFQGLPYIHAEDSLREYTKESSADDIDPPHRIRPYFPRNSGQLFWYRAS